MFEKADFLTLMPHTVYVYRVARDINNAIIRDAEGNATHEATPYTYRARVVGKILTLRRGDREDLTVIYDIYLGARVLSSGLTQPVGNDVFTVDDRVTLDGDPAWIDQTPTIFAIARVTDEDGFHHVKLQGGWMYHRQGQ